MVGNNTSDDSKDALRSKYLFFIYSAVVVINGGCIFLWIYYEKSLEDILIALIPNILTNFLTYAAIKWYWIDLDNSVSLKSINVNISRNLVLTNLLSEKLNGYPYDNFDITNTKRDSKINSADNEVTTMLKLQPSFNLISRSLFEFKDKFIDFLPFLEFIFNERVDEIKSIAGGDYKFETEIHRESFTNKLFKHLTSLRNVKVIQSLTWDEDNYFLDYWKSYVTEQEFLLRNTNADIKDIIIQRIIILKKDHDLIDKFKTLSRIYSLNRPFPRSSVRWFYEDDLTGKFSYYINTKSSFLMLLDEHKQVRLITENYQFKENGKDKSSDVRISKGDAASERISRFENLWNVPCRDLDEEYKKINHALVVENESKKVKEAEERKIEEFIKKSLLKGLDENLVADITEVSIEFVKDVHQKISSDNC